MELKSIKDTHFKTYARIIETDITKLKMQLSLEEIQSCVANYIPSDTKLEQNSVIQTIARIVFGEQAFIAGRCFGRSRDILGLEFHNSSEVLIAITDFIYVVGHRWDMNGDYYDSQNLEAFYIPQGTVIETYATTLHYNLINAKSEPYHAICILPQGTGDVLRDGRKGILKKNNKWFIAHTTNSIKLKEGDFPGLIGEVWKL